MSAGSLHKNIESEQGMKIKSLKISLDSQYNSREYGFITFETSETAKKALERGLKDIGADVVVDSYNPRDKNSMRNAVNTIFVKNFPTSWKAEELK